MQRGLMEKRMPEQGARGEGRAGRVLIITPHYSNIGGAVRCSSDLFDRLPARGFEVDMLVGVRMENDPANVRGLRMKGEKYLRALEWITGETDRRHVGSIVKMGAICDGEYDVVHLHNIHGGWTSVRAVTKLCRRIASVFTMHDEWAPTGGLPYDLSRVMKAEEIERRWPWLKYSHPGQKESVARRKFLEKWAPRPDAIICPSKYLGEMVHESGMYQDVPVHLIPYGLTMNEQAEATADRAMARREFGLGAEDKVILLIAAHFVNPYKGTPLAIEAIGKLTGKNVKLLVLGGFKEEITSKVKLPVIAPGFIKEEAKLAHAYRAADVTLVPSVADNFPYVALESLACETPLVAFKVGGLKEITGENQRGLLAECFDTEEYAANIQRLLEDEQLRLRLGAAGREWVRENCDMNRCIERTVDVYREAMARHGARNMS